MPKELDHWSYSAWSSWKGCKFKFFRKYLCGDKEPSGYALERGIELHLKAEQYLKGNIKVLPKELSAFRKHYRRLKALDPIVEQYWGVNKQWEFRKKKSWVVMKMDAAVPPRRELEYTLIIQDLKTGQEYGSHRDQGDLYATIGLAKYPEAEKVDVEFWYADQGYPQTFMFKTSYLKNRIEYWTEQGLEMLSKKQKWPPEPSEKNCKWCFLRTDKGGPCAAWKKLRNVNSGRR